MRRADGSHKIIRMVTMALKTGIVKGEIFLRHIPGDGCPDTPQRLKDLYSMLDDPDMQDAFVDILPFFDNPST